MKKKLLDIYKTCLKNGRLPTQGLCSTLRLNDINMANFHLFCPTSSELKELYKQGLSDGFWGSELLRAKSGVCERAIEFSTLRQTIICFLIAMED